MMPSAFLSNYLSAGRLGRGSLIDAPKNEDENHAIHEFQKCMEDVRRENPRLSIGAQQQMALKQCSKLNEEREARCQQSQMRRFSVPEDLIKGVISKLQIGGKQSSFGAEGEDGVGLNAGSSTHASGVDGGKKERSIAVRQSVAVSKDDQNFLAQMDWNESENEDSLQDSLENIEKSTSCWAEPEKSHDRRPRRARNSSARNNSMRYSRRASGLSSVGLPDVEEHDEESGSGDSNPFEDEADGNRDIPGRMEHRLNPTTITDHPPDEISVLLKDSGAAGAVEALNNNEEKVTWTPVGQGRRKGDKASRGHHKCSLHRSNAAESNASSFLSVDSANFSGDFWAWRSVSSRSSHSS